MEWRSIVSGIYGNVGVTDRDFDSDSGSDSGSNSDSVSISGFKSDSFSRTSRWRCRGGTFKGTTKAATQVACSPPENDLGPDQRVVVPNTWKNREVPSRNRVLHQTLPVKRLVWWSSRWRSGVLARLPKTVHI
mgnify:CR=1 FL=1